MNEGPLPLQTNPMKRNLECPGIPGGSKPKKENNPPVSQIHDVLVEKPPNRSKISEETALTLVRATLVKTFRTILVSRTTVNNKND